MPATVPLTVAATEADAGTLVAERILDRLAGCGSLRVGCPAGRTPTSTYAALGRLARERGVDLSGLTIVMMDEYAVRRGAGFAACDVRAPASCHRYVAEQLLPLVNDGVPARHRVVESAVRWPRAEEPGAYDSEIADLGGIDVFLVASGASDGHVAFNPPGSALDSRTRIVELAATTRRDNLATFPAFASSRRRPSVRRHGRAGDHRRRARIRAPAPRPSEVVRVHSAHAV